MQVIHMPTSGDTQAHDTADLEFQHAMARMHRMRYIPIAETEGITPAELHVFMCIGQAAEMGQPCRPREIGRMMNLSPSALSQTLGSLERKGLIERRRSEHDGRSVAIELTEQGQEMLRRGNESIRKTFLELREHMGEENIREFSRLLRIIDEFMQQQVADGKMKAVPHPCVGRSPYHPAETATREGAATEGA